VSDRAARLALALVAVAGLALASYLTYVHYRPDALLCTTGGGCETVQESDYATLAGIPVALLGALGYLAVLVLVAIDTRGARLATAVLGVTSVCFAAYLVLLQAFVIDAWCTWCLVNDLVVVPLLAGLSLVRLRGLEDR
jgi:uncharacterized membrane protein